jgi:putative ubiquitin-RnfH superfamily antitoxin RatB of RatAB toxin-antitoxin module
MAERVITIEVVYASADRQHVRRVNVPETSTVMDAITALPLTGWVFFPGVSQQIIRWNQATG